jgi:hypothetical protein
MVIQGLGKVWITDYCTLIHTTWIATAACGCMVRIKMELVPCCRFINNQLPPELYMLE